MINKLAEQGKTPLDANTKTKLHCTNYFVIQIQSGRNIDEADEYFRFDSYTLPLRIRLDAL